MNKELTYHYFLPNLAQLTNLFVRWNRKKKTPYSFGITFTDVMEAVCQQERGKRKTKHPSQKS